MTFSEILLDVYKVEEQQRLSYALRKYSNLFPEDIVEYFLVRHCSCYSLPLFNYFSYIDVSNCVIKIESITSEEVFSLVDYGPPCTFREEDIDAFNCLSKHYNYWPNGTWSAPILVVKKDDKLLTIDGNNRLRMLRMFLKYSKNEKSNLHQIYLLEQVE